MEDLIISTILNPWRLLIIVLFVVILYYLGFIQNKYEKALHKLKSDPTNHDYFNEVMRIGREHMYHKRRQHIGYMQSIEPDTPREELVEEAYRLYGDDQIKADIYRVVGRSYY